MATQKMTSSEDCFPPEMKLDELLPRARRCTGCALHKKRAEPCVGGGAPGALVAFVVGKPSQGASRSSGLLRGPEREFFEGILDRSGLHIDDVWITSATACPPGRGSFAASWGAKCRPRLHQELRLVEPEVIVSLGNIALGALFHKKIMREPVPMITYDHGRMVTLTLVGRVPFDVPVMVSHDLVSVLREPDPRPTGKLSRVQEHISEAITVARAMRRLRGDVK